MKVICIDALPHKNQWAEFFKLIECKVYVAEEDETNSIILGEPAYYFPELDQAYTKKRFVPLSDIDEMELVNEGTLIYALSKL